MSAKPTYLTTFCNKPHRVKSGAPVGHECYVMVPAAIRAEMDDRVSEYLEAGGKVHTGIRHRGVKGGK